MKVTEKNIKKIRNILLIVAFVGICAYAFAANTEDMIFGHHDITLHSVLSTGLFTATVLSLLCAPDRFRKTAFDIVMLLYAVIMSAGSLLLMADILGLALHPGFFTYSFILFFMTPYHALSNVLFLLRSFFQNDTLWIVSYAVTAAIGILGIAFAARSLHTRHKNKTDCLSESPAAA